MQQTRALLIVSYSMNFSSRAKRWNLFIPLETSRLNRIGDLVHE